MYHRLPYQMWPKAMIIRGVGDIVMWLNAFPPAGGISPEYSPRLILTGHPINYERHCKIPFGQYVQAMVFNEPTNTPRERTIDAIKLRALDNIQGGYEVLNLATGKTVTCQNVKPLPVNEFIIKRVEHWAARDGAQ